MKEIKLTQGKVALIDDEDFDFLNQWKWHAQKAPCSYYAVRDIVHAKERTRLYMHRIIMKTPLGLFVDHIDHNGLNCQKANMRNCTRKQNNINVIAWGKSKYLGVSLSEGRYIRAQIKINGKSVTLGLFTNEEDAARAYDKAAREYHGEFANLNFK